MKTEISVLGRSGFHKDFTECGAKEKTVLVSDTPFGDSSPLHIFEYKDLTFGVMSRHGEDGHYNISAPFVNTRANLWALKSAGVKRIISWSAPGSIDENIEPGDIVLPDDALDETRQREYTFFKNKGIGFIRQSPVFCPRIRNIGTESLENRSFTLHRNATYVATEGPRLETPAEIKKYKITGGDIVGMTVVPEVFLARELEMCYGAFCYSVNYAEGIKNRKTVRGELFEGLATGEEKKDVEELENSLARLTLPVLKALKETPRECKCKDSMLKYKRRGDIDENWENWIL